MKDEKVTKAKLYTYAEMKDAVAEAIGEKYAPMYGERWVYITDEDIAQLKEGKMLYNTDGEYAYCIVYKEEE